MTPDELKVHRELSYLRVAGRAHIKHRRKQPPKYMKDHARAQLAVRRQKLGEVQ